jgi:hypothetical protein
LGLGLGVGLGLGLRLGLVHRAADDARVHVALGTLELSSAQGDSRSHIGWQHLVHGVAAQLPSNRVATGLQHGCNRDAATITWG